MRKGFMVCQGILLMVMTYSCISFKIPLLNEPENKVEQILLCRSVEVKEDILVPVDIRSEFKADEEEIICFVRIKDTSRSIRLRWKWYSPEREIIRDTGDIKVNPEDKYLELITAYDRFQASDSNEESHWMVAVFIDDNLVGIRSFILK